MRLEHAGKKKSYLMAAAGILVGYLFFFTSSLWYPGQNNASEYTPIGQLQKIGETENSVTIEYWAYASEQQAMSVELDINTAEKVSFEAVDKKRREIPVTVKLSQAGTYVLELDSVQPDFQAVSLRVTVEGKTIRLYTNEKQVDQVKELKFYQDLDGYYQARINRNIQSLEQEIADQKELIQKLNEEISSCQKQIDQTNERLPYLSRQQRTDAENSIEDWKKQIESYQTQQKEAKEQITELTDEIENEKQIFVKGHTIQTMAEPERENLVLDGWFYDNQTTDECEYYTDIFTEDVTLYAGWINEDDGTAWQYTTQANDTVEITAYTGKRRYLTVPKELEGKKVTSIGEGAFAENTRLRQVILPDSLTQISERAFFNCNGLREIEIPEKVKQIGSETFYGCTRLSQVSIVTNGDLKTIGEQAFAMSGITSVNLPVNLTELASNAFYASTNLKTVNVANGNKTFRVINDALYNIGGDTLLYYPAGKSGDYEVADKTISIGDYAFAYTKSQEVVFPETMETFGKSSFYSSSVSKVSIPANVTTFGGAMFSNSRLKEITFASELKAEKLADDMFSWCWNLRTVMIPKAICELGSNTFAVSGLREVSFADGSKISTIGGCAFRGCQIEEFHVPDGVTAIEQSTFYFCQNLKVLEFGKNSSCQMIGDYALADCPRLEKLELPSKMRNIRSRALWNSGLKEIVIGSGVESIEEGTFSHCQKLNTITVDSGNRNYTAEKGVLLCVYQNFLQDL